MSQLGPKLRRLADDRLGFWCPGCQEMHVVWIAQGAWGWDGSVEAPTILPSILVTYNGADAGQEDADGRRAPPAVCHSFVRQGMIEFLWDSTHSMKGQRVALPDLPAHACDP